MELARSVVPPVSNQHTHTAILLHGRGGTAADFADEFLRVRDSSRRALSDIFPTVRWVFPQAEPIHCERLDQDLSQWFDVWNTLDFAEQEDLQASGLRDSVVRMRKLVTAEAARVGGLESVVLGGFGQGGSTAVHTLLNICDEERADENGERYVDDGGENVDEGDGEMRSQSSLPSRAKRLAALICLSSSMPFPGGTLEETREILALKDKPSDDILYNTPIFLGHCEDDPVIFPELGEQLRRSLVTFGLRTESKVYADGGHAIKSPNEVDDVVKFLQHRGFWAADK